MNQKTKEHIRASLAQGVRLDGRALDEFRPIEIEFGVVDNAEGSARVRVGDNEVLAGVKLGLGEPFPDRPESGALMVNAELIPMSSPNFEGGPPGINAIEASRVIDRGIRESKSIDEKELCVTAGESVWVVNVDVYPINFNGNMIDVGGIAAVAAIINARFPTLNGKDVDYKNLTEKGLPLSQIPVPITVLKIGDQLIVDPTEEEEEAADCKMTVTTIDDGSICSLQKGGDAAILVEELNSIFELAIKKGAEIREIIKKAKN